MWEHSSIIKRYSYFVQAVDLAAKEPDRLTDVCKEIYAPIAEKNHTTVSNVNKISVRFATVSGKTEAKNGLLNGQAALHGKSKKPYPKEFIGIMVRLLEDEAKTD